MTDYILARIHDEQRFTTIIYATGRRLVKWVSIDSPITVTQRPLDEERFAQVISDEDKDVRRAARKMLKAGRKLGITKTARAFLKDAATRNEDWM